MRLKSCLFSLLMVVGFIPTTMAATQPNVLFVICDDLTTRIGPHGFAGIKTPILDQFAKEGMTFTRNYCQYPVCGPSRASFLSGMYPESTGVLDNNSEIGEVHPGAINLPRAFRNAGYWTGGTGKFFHRSGANPGNDSWDVVTSFENDELPIERDARLAFEKEHGPITDKANKAAWKKLLPTIAPQTRNQGLEGVGPGRGPSGLTDEQHADGKNALQVAEWITKKSFGDKPFFIGCGLYKPHIPTLAPQKYFDLYPLSSLDISKDTIEGWNSIPKLAMVKGYAAYGFDAQKPNPDLARQYMQSYHACVSFIDAQLGVMINALKASGQWENTIIIFLGDNGYHLGEHFHWGKVTLFEPSDNVPFMMRAPGITTAGSRSEGKVESLDCFPTLMELCRISPPTQLQGKSLVPILKDPKTPGKDVVYTVVSRGKDPIILGTAIRFENWRYTEWGSPTECELYDLSTDHAELNNLAPNTEYATIRAKAHALLAAKRVEALSKRTDK